MPPPHNKTPRPDSCPNIECPYEREKETWFDSKLLKVSGVIIGLLSPLFVWIVISIFSIQSDLAVQKEKLGALMEIRQDIKSMQLDINTIKIDLATMKVSKGTP
jgi:hypothetical protein